MAPHLTLDKTFSWSPETVDKEAGPCGEGDSGSEPVCVNAGPLAPRSASYSQAALSCLPPGWDRRAQGSSLLLNLPSKASGLVSSSLNHSVPKGLALRDRISPEPQCRWIQPLSRACAAAASGSTTGVAIDLVAGSGRLQRGGV